MLLDVCSARLGGGGGGGGSNGDSLGCRGHRLCGSGLPVMRGVLHQATEDFPSCPYCTRLHKEHSSWRDVRSDTRTRTLRAPALSIESFLHTPTHDGGEGGGGGAGFSGRRWQEISPTLHPAGRPSRQTCCRCRPGWTLSSSYWEEKRHNGPSLAL